MSCLKRHISIFYTFVVKIEEMKNQSKPTPQEVRSRYEEFANTSGYGRRGIWILLVGLLMAFSALTHMSLSRMHAAVAAPSVERLPASDPLLHRVR